MGDNNNNNARRGAIPRNNNFNNNNNQFNVNRGRRDRAQGFRQNVGVREMAAFAARRDNALFEGFGNLQGYLNEAGTHVVPSAQDLIITTRGLGHMVEELFDRLEIQLTAARMAGSTVHQLYRCALMQLGCKMSQSYKNMIEHHGTVSGLFHDMIPMDIERMVIGNPQMFTPISGIINSIGNITVGDQRYHIGMSHTNNMSNITIDRLRAYTELLANPLTALEIRLAAFNQNAIPGADFGDPLNPLLANADDIIPAVYGVANALDDFRLIHVLMDNCARRIPHYIGRVEYVPDGTPSILMSNIINNNPIQWWSPKLLTPAQATIGAIAKCGEVMEPLNALEPGMIPRSPYVQAMSCDIEHRVVRRGLLG